MLYFEQFISAIKIIQTVFKKKMNEIEGNIDRNMTETYDYNKRNSSNNSKCLKLISLIINNISDYYKQLNKIVIIIQSLFDNAKIGDVLNITFR